MASFFLFVIASGHMLFLFLLTSSHQRGAIPGNYDFLFYVHICSIDREFCISRLKRLGFANSWHTASIFCIYYSLFFYIPGWTARPGEVWGRAMEIGIEIEIVNSPNNLTD